MEDHNTSLLIYTSPFISQKDRDFCECERQTETEKRWTQTETGGGLLILKLSRDSTLKV